MVALRMRVLGHPAGFEVRGRIVAMASAGEMRHRRDVE